MVDFVAVTCKIAGKPVLFRFQFYFKATIVLNVHVHNFSFIFFSWDATVKNIFIVFFWIVVGTLNLINVIFILIIPAKNGRSHCLWNASLSMASFNHELIFYPVTLIERFITENYKPVMNIKSRNFLERTGFRDSCSN